jgi:N-glycosylase/DNA lyase
MTPVRCHGRFSLSDTLESGQFFRWSRHGDAYLVETAQRIFLVRQTGRGIEVLGADEAFVRDFFSLDQDLEAALGILRRDRKLGPALDASPGLRLLRQDPWECTVSFLLSMASNIPRITRNLADLARAYGRPVRLGALVGHQFPRPGQLGDEASLRRLRVGFRAKYLVAAERRVRGGLFEEVAGLGTEEARQALMAVPGIAEKVADCILLFAFGRGDAFPLDTWIRKAMTRILFGGRKVPDRAIRECARERWGALAGVAQQYLYHWYRRGGRPTGRGFPAASRAGS